MVEQIEVIVLDQWPRAEMPDLQCAEPAGLLAEYNPGGPIVPGAPGIRSPAGSKVGKARARHREIDVQGEPRMDPKLQCGGWAWTAVALSPVGTAGMTCRRGQSH
jgi:hypothetical protein